MARSVFGRTGARLKRSALSVLVAAMLATPALTAQSLQAGDAKCPAGLMAAPINIEGTDPVRTFRLDPRYQIMPLGLRNSDDGLTLDIVGDHDLHVGERVWHLRQVVFRTPSEHTVLTQRFPMEIQLIHSNDAGDAAVVSVLVSEGQSHPAIEEIWPHLPIERGQINRPADVRVNVRDLLPPDTAYYRYQGTLSAPPCTPGTAWYVLKTPVQLSAAQISAARSVQGVTAAPLNPRNNRIILDTAQ